ncbi:translation initiation factor 1A / IF-1 domain-containing protein [Ditylenchus destructor]|uniref:Translation initiation factor IF-1, chloroplastic n=1 Tax=Ditylenchus destructor TaxID=166010 RepID=A0AAD4QUX9_9BILA|nr:translation initiation factor 1A / IF-1 domain-containing protein [Ditylenchus destructor]
MKPTLAMCRAQEARQLALAADAPLTNVKTSRYWQRPPGPRKRSPPNARKSGSRLCGPGGLKAMAKEELMTLDGMIDEILPDGRFRVLLENDHQIIAYTAGRMRRNRIRSVVGDRVQVEMTPYDLDKGRIIYRERTPGSGFGTPRGARRR